MVCCRQQQGYLQRTFFILQLPHAPRLRGFHALPVTEDGEPATVCAAEAVWIGEHSKTVPSSIPWRTVEEVAFGIRLTSLSFCFLGFEKNVA